MKKFKYILFAAAGLLILGSSCKKSEQDLRVPEEEATVQVTYSGTFPQSLVKALTKVTFNDSDSLVWEPADAVSLLVGGESSTGTRVGGNNSLSIPLYTKLDDVDGTPLPGIFTGPVSFTPFRREDIRGVVYPYKPAQYFRRQWSGGDAPRRFRIGMQVGGAPQADGNFLQTQSRAGVLNGENIALFSLFSIDDAEERLSNDRLTFEGMELQWGCSMIRFNIYGKAYGMEDDEVLKEITLHPGNIALAGEQEWNYTDQVWVFSGTAGKTITVRLDDSTGATLADKTKDNGLKIYMSTRTGEDFVGQLAGIASLTVTTDKNSYVIPVTANVSLKPGVVACIGIDMAGNFPEPYQVKGTEYSADNSTWSETIPSSFTALYVKGNTDAAVIASVREAVDAQTAPVDLDFSQADYESATFPDTFTGCTKVKSVKFQSNVKAVADAAFKGCSALQEANLDQIDNFGEESFMGTSLRSIRLDRNVTNLGISCFRDIYTLEEVYYNPADPRLSDFNSSTRVDFRTFQWESADVDSHYKDLTVTVAAGAQLGRYAFANNGNVTRIIFEKPEATSRQGNQSIYNNKYLRFVEIKAVPVRTAEGGLSNYISMSGSTESVLGANVTLPKYLIVPEGTTDLYVEMSTAETTDPMYNGYYQLVRILVNKSAFQIVEEGNVPEDPTPDPADYQWSTDGSTWSDEAPSAAYSTLYIKGELNAAALTEIKNSVNAQSEVALDLSQATYESEVFPNTFAGTTVGGNGVADGATVNVAGSPIVSIKFPSNVTEIGSGAFIACTKLKEVDFSGITTIGGSAFRAAGFTTLTLPASIRQIGNYAFSYIWSLTELHFNCVLSTEVTQGGQIFALRNGTGPYEDLPDMYKAGNFSFMTAYIGAGATIPGYLFDTNHKLQKVVFEGKPASTGNAWLIRTRFLETIDCTAITDAEPYLSGGGNYGAIGEQVTGEKKILVPSGRKDDYYDGYWKILVDNRGYVIDDGTKASSTLPDPNWDNEDTPWKRGSGE